jgi:hypothetical protein
MHPPTDNSLLQRSDQQNRSLIITSWVLIALTCLGALVPLLGFAVWLVAAPVLFIVLVMGIIVLSRGGTLPGIFILFTALIVAPVFILFAPFVTSFLGVTAGTAAVATVAASEQRADANRPADERHELPARVAGESSPDREEVRTSAVSQSAVEPVPGGYAQSIARENFTPQPTQPPLTTAPMEAAPAPAPEADPEAEYLRGRALSKGDGVPRDLDEAARSFRRAADAGHPAAQHQLGVAYAKGWGVAQSDREAVAWYRKAAEQGMAEAQYDLGVRCMLGQGTDRNPAEGAHWYRQAAGQGYAEAIQALRRAGLPPVGVPATSTNLVGRICRVVGVESNDTLNVRSAPAMASTSAFRLANGERVQIRGDAVTNGETEWIPITFGTKQGWVRSKYLQAE